jgi:hypothetical protein
MLHYVKQAGMQWGVAVETYLLAPGQVGIFACSDGVG